LHEEEASAKSNILYKVQPNPDDYKKAAGADSGTGGADEVPAKHYNSDIGKKAAGVDTGTGGDNDDQLNSDNVDNTRPDTDDMGKGMDMTAASTDSGTGGPDKVPPNTDPDNVGKTQPNTDDMGRDMDKTAASNGYGTGGPDEVPPNTNNLEKDSLEKAHNDRFSKM
jgi:hypothetical protein